MNIFSNKDKIIVKCDIILLPRLLVPKKRDGWAFNWIKAYNAKPKSVYCLKENLTERIHGLIQLIEDDGMLIMELIELAPFNIGSSKEFNNVAGCLIAFGCREALKLNTAYKGYLTFLSKTELVELYKRKYLATQAIGTRMYIDPISGKTLINKYLEDEEG